MRAAVALVAFLILCPQLAVAQTPAWANDRPVISQSRARAVFEAGQLLMMEHAVRIAFQEKTRAQLGGPFWGDYKRSVRMPVTWEDSDPWYTNYVGHPIHGAASGFIWIDNGPAKDRALSYDKSYWVSRAKAAAFAAAYSVQFEIGPLSEASIGNVGLDPKTTGWVDYVVTPAGAFALVVGEDLMDRYFVRWVETHTNNRLARASLRMLFGPSRTLANMSEHHLPWYRSDRPLDWPR
jgi:hypothetical protein